MTRLFLLIFQCLVYLLAKKKAFQYGIVEKLNRLKDINLLKMEYIISQETNVINFI